MLVEIGDKIVSAIILQEKFVCDLTACKGACCVVGDAGAPLESQEIDLLESVLDEIKPFMSKKGISAIENQGVFYMDRDNDAVTTLVDDGACAFVNFNDDGVALCSIEMAYRAKKINWKKPISCELFPIRAKQYPKFEALNYEEIEICKPACECGSKLNVPVYKFLKEPITKAYGEEFYNELNQVAKALNKSKKSQSNE